MKYSLFFMLFLFSINFYCKSQELYTTIHSDIKHPLLKQKLMFKAYLVNKSGNPVTIVNPKGEEPGWSLTKDVWSVINSRNEKVNKKPFIDGATGRFGSENLLILNAGDSIAISYYQFKFEEPGNYKVSYKYVHNPKLSTLYEKRRAAKKLSIFTAESKTYQYTIKQSTLTSFEPNPNVDQQFLSKQKEYTNLDEAVSNAKDVYKLNVSDVDSNDLRKIEQLLNLRNLTIRKSPIDSLSVGLVTLPYLSTLSFETSSYNTIWVPDELGERTELRSLSLKGYGNNLRLPKSMAQMKSLKWFTTINLNYNKLPNDFCELNQLTYLIIRNNTELDRLPENFNKLKEFETIEITKCPQLTRFPNVFEAKDIFSINLDGNSIASLPGDIIKLKKLQHLILSGNKLTELPEGLLELESISLFNVKNNNFPKKYKRLKKLKKHYEYKFHF